jgi:hypothetical protein
VPLTRTAMLVSMAVVAGCLDGPGLGVSLRPRGTTVETPPAAPPVPVTPSVAPSPALTATPTAAPALSPTATPKPTASPRPAVAPSPARPDGLIYGSDWSGTGVGREPGAFADPAREPGAPAWLASGTWQVTRIVSPAFTGLAYQASEERPQPWLSFRVLKATIPDRYGMTARVQAVSSPHLKGPVGEISLIPYYRDPTHYLEVLLTNDHVGIWLADGAAPDTDRGWTGLRYLPSRTAIGQVQTVVIAMDLTARRLAVTLGDETYAITHAFLDPAKPHRVAVRSAGNTFNLIDFRVERTGAAAP